jgi:hypothetical protein
MNQAMTPRKISVDRFLERLKKKPVVAGLIALGALVIGLSTFTDAVRNLAGLATGLRGPSPEEARAQLGRLSVGYSKEAFSERVQQGDQAAAKLFLAAGMDASVAVDPEGNTALMVAASNGRTSIVDEMLKSGADVNVTNRERVSALMRAATQSDATLVRTLLDAGADLNHRDSRGETALSFAAARGRRENVVLMVESGAAPEAIDRAFVMASKYSESEIARLLLDRGADVTKVGGEALVEAIRQDATGRINDNVKRVIDMVGDVSLPDPSG